jgi:hypothetical protein
VTAITYRATPNWYRRNRFRRNPEASSFKGGTTPPSLAPVLVQIVASYRNQKPCHRSRFHDRQRLVEAINRGPLLRRHVIGVAPRRSRIVHQHICELMLTWGKTQCSLQRI